MRNHTQNPRISEQSGIQPPLQLVKTIEPASRKPALQAIFNLVKASKGTQSIICTALTGEQAISLATALQSELNSPFLVKFTNMEVVK